MKKPLRLLILLLLFSLILLAAGLNWPYVLNYIIMPLASTAWLLLRIFILSIDQKYIWGALILAVVLLLLYRLGQDTNITAYEETFDENSTLKNIAFWKTFIKFNNDPSDDYRSLKLELQRLLVAVYASNRQGVSNFEVLEAIKKGDISLPPHIYSFLFTIEDDSKNNFLKKLRTPRKWLRRISGQDQAEHYAALEEFLTYLESSLEIKYDK